MKFAFVGIIGLALVGLIYLGAARGEDARGAADQAAAPIVASAGKGEALPTFGGFPVPPEERYEGEPVPVAFPDDLFSEEDERILMEEAARGVNFAGRYTIVTRSCGSLCQLSTIINAETGAIVEEQLYSQYGLRHQADSRLLAVNPLSSRPPHQTGDQTLATDFYVMRSGNLKLIRKVNERGEVADVCPTLPVAAQHPQTSEIRVFPTPCEVPSGWQRVTVDPEV